MAGSLTRSTAVVGGTTGISRVTGFVRDIVLARVFGAGAAMDAFFVAFKIPNFLRRLFAEGSFAQAFVPVFTEYQSRDDPAAVREMADRVAGTLGAVLLGVTAVGVVGAPVLIAVFAPGFVERGEQYELAVSLLRITFPYLLFISLTALAGGILNANGRFGVPAFTPVLLNLALIGGALGLAPHMAEPVTGLAWGVFIAGVVQLAFQLPFLARLKLLPRPRWGWRHPPVRQILRLMLPTLFGSSVAQVNLLVDTLIASLLAAGSVSWLYYSDRLMEFPLGVFGIALATVILPSLSARYAEEDPRRFSDTLDWALRLVLVIGAPAALGLLLLAGPILATLFGSRVFGGHDVAMATVSLMAYALGLLGYILVKVLVPGFYARQDTRTPVIAGVIAMTSNMVLSVAIVFPLVRTGYGAPHAGLALATSVAAYINAGVLLYRLRRDGVYRPRGGWARTGMQVALACAAMTALLVYAVAPAAIWMDWSAWTRAGELVLWLGAGALVYGASLLITGMRPRHLLGRSS